MKISYNGLTVEVDEKEILPEVMLAMIDKVVEKGRELSGTQGCSLKTSISGSDLVAVLERNNKDTFGNA